MPVHQDNLEVKLIDRNGTDFFVRISHTEEAGQHTVVIAADQENMSRLQNSREAIANKIKTEHGIATNSNLDYIERLPNGSLYKVNLDNVKPGRGKNGEPEYLKNEGQWVKEEQVQTRLTTAKMPETPVKVRPAVNLSEAQFLQATQKLRQQEIRRQQQQKPKL